MGYLGIVVLVYLVINVIVASYMKNVAYAKGYDDNAHAFAISFFLGIAGWIYVVALPDLIARDNQEKIIRLLSNGALSGTDGRGDLPEL